MTPYIFTPRRLRERARDKSRWLKLKSDPCVIAKRAAYRIQYREKNRAWIKAKDAARIRDPEYMKEKARKRYLLNIEKMKARNLAYRTNPNNKPLMRIYEKRYLNKNPWVRSKKNNARRAATTGVKSDKTAALFYKFVRSKKTIPCYYCGKKMSGRKAHVDHIVAISRNGNHSSENLCASCPDCNLHKSAKSVLEWKNFGQTLLPI